MAGVIAANIFHPFRISGASVIWAAELNELEKMLSAAVHPRGVAERVLLDWFGMKAERVAMLVFALHGVIPTHVAREFDIGNFRSDFAWISNNGLGEHQVGLVELEDALPETLFTSNGRKTRNTPYIGMRFLSGFSQLVDWCSFGQAEVARHPLISNVIGAYRGPVLYYFALVAGVDHFSPGAFAENRMQWWDANIKLGNGTSIKTFSKMCTLMRLKLSYVPMF